jgi:hypothetical protein
MFFYYLPPITFVNLKSKYQGNDYHTIDNYQLCFCLGFRMLKECKRKIKHTSGMETEQSGWDFHWNRAATNSLLDSDGSHILIVSISQHKIAITAIFWGRIGRWTTMVSNSAFHLWGSICCMIGEDNRVVVAEYADRSSMSRTIHQILHGYSLPTQWWLPNCKSSNRLISI